MGKPKYVDCWTYPKPVLDEKLGEIKSDVSAMSEQVETLSNAVEDISDAVESISGNFASSYDSTATYSVGDLCIYNYELYKCTTAIATAEEWTPGHWTQTTVEDTFENLSGEVETLSETAETINANISDEYDSTATYSVGDLCIYENELYKCTTVIATAEEWNSSHWEGTTIAEEINKTETVTVIVNDTSVSAGTVSCFTRSGWCFVTCSGIIFNASGNGLTVASGLPKPLSNVYFSPNGYNAYVDDFYMNVNDDKIYANASADTYTNDHYVTLSYPYIK